MENNNINHLIHKYYTPDGANLTANNKKTPGERHTPTYRKQQKHSNPRLQVENYTISHKYELNNNTLLLIQNRLIFELMRTTPLTYNQSIYLNREILEKGELENGFSSKYK